VSAQQEASMGCLITRIVAVTAVAIVAFADKLLGLRK